MTSLPTQIEGASLHLFCNCAVFVAVMMDVKPQTQRIQMIEPHRQCLRTEMPPSDHTAKDIALNGLNRKRRRPQWIKPPFRR
jgi:hypothetical protein